MVTAGILILEKDLLSQTHFFPSNRTRNLVFFFFLEKNQLKKCQRFFLFKKRRYFLKKKKLLNSRKNNSRAEEPIEEEEEEIKANLEFAVISSAICEPYIMHELH